MLLFSSAKCGAMFSSEVARFKVYNAFLGVLPPKALVNNMYAKHLTSNDLALPEQSLRGGSQTFLNSYECPWKAHF